MHTSGGFAFPHPFRRRVGVNFTKPFLTYDQQADQLIARGLHGNKATIVGHLQSVSYYRLSGYWYPLREPDPAVSGKRLDDFSPGASIETVWNRYVFDRRLRLLVMDALERIEVDARTRLAYLHSQAHSPFGYADDQNSLPGQRDRRRISTRSC